MIYIHVPFCKSFCTYCDFYSELCGAAEAQDTLSRYEAGLMSEIRSRREEILSTATCNTLYIGGGTPSVLPSSVLGRIVRALPLSDFSEFTVEVNPDDIVRGGETYVRELLALGVNRISMGVQSLDDGMLRWMNRRHSAAVAREAVRILRSAGVRNLSLDIIFGISHMTDDMLLDTLKGVLALAPEHISAYQLSIEDGSALASMVEDGRYVEASEEQCRRQYEMICSELRSAGFDHYEISNWSRPGFAAQHNSAYWSRAPYVGLGPGAHSLSLMGASSLDGASPPVTSPRWSPAAPSLMGAGVQVRRWNSQNLSDWTAEQEELTAEEIHEEEIMLGLRTAEGIPTSLICASGNASADSSVALSADVIPTESSKFSERATAVSRLERTASGNLRIPESDWFIADTLISSLF